jgi:hypothetical protein
LSAPCTRSGIIYGRDQQKAARIATIWSRICPRDTFLSANSFSFFSELLLANSGSTNFRRSKKIASFSPEFLVLTYKAGVAVAPGATTTCGRLRGASKKAFIAVNSAHNRGELQSELHGRVAASRLSSASVGS